MLILPKKLLYINHNVGEYIKYFYKVLDISKDFIRAAVALCSVLIQIIIVNSWCDDLFALIFVLW